MTDKKPDAESKPAELTDDELDQANGGSGKTDCYSYSEGQSASYASQSGGGSPVAKPGRTTYANITLEGADND